MQPRPPAWPRHDLLPAAGLAVAARRHALPATVREHSHDFAELAVVTSGSGVHRCAAGSRRIASGDVLLVPPGAWHAYGDGRGLVVLDVGIGGEVLRRELAWIVRDRELGGIGRALADAGGATVCRPPRPAFRQACADLDVLAAMAGGAGRLAHLLLALAAIAPSLPVPPAVPASVAEALRQLQDDPGRSWTLAGLARRLGVDRSRFARAFRAATGHPPMTWLARLRAERAAEMLLADERPVAEIGAAVGWPDPTHFARRFRRHHGISPGAWRRR